MHEMKTALLIVLCTALAGCKQENASPAVPKPTVVVRSIELQPVSTSITLTGRTRETQISEVRPQVTGIIQKRLFKEGEFLKAGQVLYQLDPASYKAAFDQAAAGVKSSQAELFSARLKYQRLNKLIASHVISRQDVDDAYSVFKQDLADLAQKKAELETASIDLDRTTIRSPVSGVAGVSAVTAGALVTANQSDALTEVRTLDPIYVDLQEPSQQWKRMRAHTGGAETTVKLLSDDNQPVPETGMLELAEAAVDPSTGTVKLRAVFPNPSHSLLPGMFVQAELPGIQYPEAALVPQTAVTFDHNGQASVLTVTADDRVREVNVSTDGDFKGNWIITAGLKSGDKVIIAGNNRVSAGDNVDLKTEKESGSS